MKQHEQFNSNEAYWTNRYDNNQLGWDVGAPTTPLKAYFDQLIDKEIDILIPGCGHAYEAEYLHSQGFPNVYIIDISTKPLDAFRKRYPAFPSSNLIHGDFFQFEGQFDLIIEQTFFCSFHPSKRSEYAEKMAELLKVEGKLVGVLFEDTLFKDHPPFGGFRDEYQEYFEPYFDFLYFETCYNSIPPRAGRELFINLAKK
ncbi:MAG: methyltransferase domain-containing protein [Bacteroidota bacterium]